MRYVKSTSLCLVLNVAAALPAVGQPGPSWGRSAPDAGAGHCIKLDSDGGGVYLRNDCSRLVHVQFCIEASGVALSCASGGGMVSPPAGRKSVISTRAINARVTWIACFAPSLPHGIGTSSRGCR